MNSSIKKPLDGSEIDALLNDIDYGNGGSFDDSLDLSGLPDFIDDGDPLMINTLGDLFRESYMPNLPQCKQCGKELRGYQCERQECKRYDVLARAYKSYKKKQEEESDNILFE